MTQPYLIESGSYSMRRRRAGSRNRITQSAQTKTNRDLTGRNTRDSFRNHERVKTGHTVSLREDDHLRLGRDQTAHTAAPDDTDTTAILFVQIQPAVRQGFVRYPNGELRITIQFTCLLAIHHRGDVKILHLPRKLGLEIRRVKSRNRSDSVLSVYQRLPSLRSRITYRSKGSQACHYYSS